MKPLTLTPAAGGWLHADWGQGKAWLRFATDKRGRLTRIAELHMHDPSPEKLRRIPLKRIHAAVTMREASAVQLALAARINEQPSPNVFTTDVPSPPKASEREWRTPRHRLKWTPRQRLDDEFFLNVAQAYMSAYARGLNPRKAIVDDTGAADATVAGWVSEARKRKLLPPAKPGKASA